MELVYGIKDRPPIKQNIVFALQQIIAIMAATLLVPILVGSTDISFEADGVKYIAHMSVDPAAALFGAGIGTIVYLLFTKFKSPVFLGSSFTFLGALCATAANNYGYWGLIIGVIFAALIYVIIGLVIKFVGSKWIHKLLPPVIIGPILAIIGLSLAGTAGSWTMANGGSDYNILAVLIGLFTFFMIVFASIKGKKTAKMIPFIIGIGAGFGVALFFTAFSYAAPDGSAAQKALRIVDFTPIVDCFKPIRVQSFLDYPKFTFLEGILTKGLEYQGYTVDVATGKNVLLEGVTMQRNFLLDGAAIGNLALLFIPIAVVELAQHISDHKNISNIVGKDILTDPGLHNTLFGDGVGSAVGAFFGGCANTTYGESIGCVALTRNASTWTILFAAIGCMLISFFSPFVAIINMLPKCVIGGACIALYGFIAVSGLNMLREVDLNDHKNLYPVAAILVIGIGGITFDFGYNKLTGGPAVQITALAVALIVGVLINLFTHYEGKKKKLADGEDGDTSVEDSESVNAVNENPFMDEAAADLHPDTNESVE
ncbi:MAG: uracil-xanthine permease [Clostridia bacterium]|nr:uracil-xanthine permease [Clostridia bacterium]